MSIGHVDTIAALYTVSTAVGSAAVVTSVQAADPGPGGELFVGRGEQTKALLAALAPPTAPAPAEPGAVLVCAVAGMGGIGKSALARHVAGLAVRQGWFEGGAVWVDLHGYDPAGHHVWPAQVFAPLLRVLGMPGGDIPPTVSEQATEYHRLLDTLAQTGRRVLVVLDSAADTGQVQDLLPRAAVHRVVITSRDTLAVPGATRLGLDVLTPAEARELLHATLTRRDPTDPRATGELEAVGEVIGWCGRLPLAVAIAAAVLADNPELTVAELADELRDETTRLEALDDDTGGVHAAFVTSWRRLLARDPQTAQVLCLLTVNPGPEVSTEAAAAITGLESVGAVRVRLRVLRQAHLLIGQRRRWFFHDLIRLDTRRHAIPDIGVTADELAAATDRLLDYYLAMTRAADTHLRARSGQVIPETTVFAGQEQALAWLDTEQANLTAAVGLAADTQHHRVAVDLASRLAEFLGWRRQLTDWVAVAQVAARAATHLNDPSRQADALEYLGLALRAVRRFEEAIAAHTQARDIFRDLGDRHGEGRAWGNLGLALREVRRFEEAITAHTQAGDIYRDLGDRHSEGRAWGNLGLALRAVRRFEEAITAHTQDLEICRGLGDRHGEGRAWGNLGLALREVRRFDEARRAWEQAVQAFEDSGDQDSAKTTRRWMDDLG